MIFVYVCNIKTLPSREIKGIWNRTAGRNAMIHLGDVWPTTDLIVRLGMI